MSRKPFHFKQFSIHHDKCAMKIGTDGVLLGAWAPLSNAQRILDIGTGTGVIAIMLAQRSISKVNIDAVEINEAAYNQAMENFSNCQWKDQINVHHSSLQEYSKIAEHKYDLIVSNPPFFIEGTKPKTESRVSARHVDSLTHKELISSSMNLLKEDGKLCIILPVEEGKQVIQFAEANGLFCQCLIEVKPKTDKSIERLLLSFSKTKSIRIIKEELTIQFEKRNDYTPEYIELTKEFYTIM